MKMFQSKMFLWVVIILVVVILAGGGVYFLLSGGKSNEAPTFSDDTQNVKQLTPEEIGLTLTPTSNGKQIVMQISKIDGVASIEYDVSYDADVSGETVPRGVTGAPEEIKPGQGTFKKTLDLGTCSRSVCKYDNVVSDVTFVIRLNYKNGTVAGVTTKISL